MTQHTHSHFDHEVAATNPTDWIQVTKTAILLGSGAYLLYVIATDNLSYYISPHFAWLTYLAAGLFLFFGGLNVIDLVQGRQGHHHDHDHDHDHHDHDHHDHDHDHHDHDHDDHDHAQITWGILFVFAIPLILGFGVPATPLSADSINGGISTASVGVADRDINEIPPEERNILDWLRLVDQTDDLSTLNGQPVDVIGFVYREPGFDENTVMVVRFSISCCVADAFAIGLPINTEGTEMPGQGQWIHIRGTFEAGQFDGREMLIIQPESVEPIEYPDDPYLYT